VSTVVEQQEYVFATIAWLCRPATVGSLLIKRPVPNPLFRFLQQSTGIYVLSGKAENMHSLAETGNLYPAALALANIGVGAGLYATGAFFFALLLWLSGALVLAATVPSVNRALRRSGVATE
jgi:hypothetical protein